MTTATKATGRQQSTGVVPAAHAWRDNAALIADVAKLGYVGIDDDVIDVTWGKGKFWTVFQPKNLTRHDKFTLDGVDFRNLPHSDESFDVAVLDPPYRLSGTRDRGEKDARYGTDKAMTWQETHAMIKEGITECARVLRKRGRLLLKCQNQTSSGRVRWQVDEFTEHARTAGLEKVDQFYLLGKTQSQPEGRRQVHARGHPSMLLIFEKRKKK